jgi:hypothetical protein
MGLHIYMAGVGVQLLFILVFCLVNLKMYMNLRLESSNAVKMLFLAQLIALGLIVVSIIFLAAAADGG